MKIRGSVVSYESFIFPHPPEDKKKKKKKKIPQGEKQQQADMIACHAGNIHILHDSSLLLGGCIHHTLLYRPTAVPLSVYTNDTIRRLRVHTCRLRPCVRGWGRPTCSLVHTYVPRRERSSIALQVVIPPECAPGVA